MKKQIFIVLILFLLIFQVYFYVTHEDPIYFWDYAGYEGIWKEFSKKIIINPISWLQDVISNIRSQDYNVSPIIPLIPLYFSPIGSRIIFILGVVILYLFPVSLLISKVFNKFELNQNYTWSNGVIILVSIFYVGFWKPIVRGLPDIVGLIPVILAILFIMEYNLAHRFSLKKAIILGILLWLPFLFRRWYLYTVISLYITLPLFNYYYLGNKIKVSFQNFKLLLCNFFVAGITSTLLAFILQYHMLKNVITTDYSEIYSAYQSGLKVSLSILLNTFAFTLPFFICGVIFSFSCNWLNKASWSKEKLFGVFSFFNLVFSFFLFTRTQTPEYHHLLPFLLWILFISIIGFRALISKCRINLVKKLISFVFVIIYIYVFVVTLNEVESKYNFKSFFMPAKCYPLKQENFANYRKLIKKLDTLVRKDDKVAIISSGGVLNTSLLRSVVESMPNSKLDSHFVPVSDLDLRDKINLSILEADYVVVTDPVDIHLGEKNQKVITIPVYEIIKNKGIGEAYEKIPVEFILAKNYKAYIYKKVRPFSYEEVNSFINNFINIYPDWEKDYNNPLQRAFYSAKTIIDDEYGDISFDCYKSIIFVHPGEKEPVKIVWNFKNIQSLTFSLPNNSCKKTKVDGVTVKLKNAEVEKIFQIPNGESIKVDIKDFMNKEGEIIVSKNKTLHCVGLEIASD